MQLFGSPEQQARLIPELVSGRALCAQGFTEPEAGSDLAAIATVARPVDGGYLIEGVKWLNSVAQVATYIWVIAKTDPSVRHRGLSMFLIPRDSPGIRIEPLVEMTGVHRLNRIVLDRVEVGEECLVGGLNQGWTIAMDTVARERAGAARPAGMRRAWLDLTRHAVATDRAAFTAGDVRGRLSRLATRIEACDALYHQYARQSDDGTAVPELAGTTLKVYADEVEQDLADEGTEILGRFGVLDISDTAPIAGRIARLHVGAPGFSLGGGTSEILRTVVATRGLGLPRGGASSDDTNVVPAQPDPRLRGASPTVGPAPAFDGAAVARLAENAGALEAALGEDGDLRCLTDLASGLAAAGAANMLRSPCARPGARAPVPRGRRDADYGPGRGPRRPHD